MQFSRLTVHYYYSKVLKLTKVLRRKDIGAQLHKCRVTLRLDTTE